MDHAILDIWIHAFPVLAAAVGIVIVRRSYQRRLHEAQATIADLRHQIDILEREAREAREARGDEVIADADLVEEPAPPPESTELPTARLVPPRRRA